MNQGRSEKEVSSNEHLLGVSTFMILIFLVIYWLCHLHGSKKKNWLIENKRASHLTEYSEKVLADNEPVRINQKISLISQEILSTNKPTNSEIQFGEKMHDMPSIRVKPK